MSDVEHIEDEQVAAHALRALPSDEEAQVDAHAGKCPRCRNILEETQEAAHLLAFAVTPARPPRHCKARVLERIEREQVLLRPAPRQRPRASWTNWAVMGAVVVLLLSWNMHMQREVAKARTIQEILVADPQPTVLKPHPRAPRAATARLYIAPRGTSAVLVVENLAPAPPGKVYRIWIGDVRRRVPMGTFQVGRSIEPVMVHLPPEPLKWLGITVEDAAGGNLPSEPALLSGDL